MIVLIVVLKVLGLQSIPIDKRHIEYFVFYSVQNGLEGFEHQNSMVIANRENWGVMKGKSSPLANREFEKGSHIEGLEPRVQIVGFFSGLHGSNKGNFIPGDMVVM